MAVQVSTGTEGCSPRAQSTDKALRGLLPSFFGFAFVRAYYDILTLYSSQLAPGLAWLGQDLVVVGMLPAFLVCTVGARKILPLASHRRLPLFSGTLMIVGAFCMTFAPCSDGTTALLASAALVGGLGSGIAILLWAEVQSCCAPLPLVLYVTGAFFTGSLLGWLLEGLDTTRLFVAMATLSVVGNASIAAAMSHVPSTSRPKGYRGQLRFPWKLVTLGIYELVLGVRQGSGAFSGEAFTVGILLASALLFVATMLLSSRFDFTYAYRTPFLLMTCGLLATLGSLSSASFVADILVATGYALMFLVLTVLLCDIARKCGVSAALLCSIEELVMFTSLLGHAAGSALASEQSPLGPNDPAALMLLAALVVIASVALLTEREYDRWGFALFGMDELASAAIEQRRTEREANCRRLAQAKGLSPRELEVLLRVAEGQNATRIEQELCIAPGTLKSHTRRIYRKCGVHRREDLLELLDGKAVPTSS